MLWTWDPEKNRTNQQKHGINFETAQLVFRDPHHRIREDPHPQEQRWQIMGVIEGTTVTVIYTLPEAQGQPGRIINARRATRQERRKYEQG